MSFRDGCWACGRTDVRKRPRHGKLHYAHKCRHGAPCIAGDSLAGIQGNNWPRCPDCLKEKQIELRTALSPTCTNRAARHKVPVSIIDVQKCDAAHSILREGALVLMSLQLREHKRLKENGMLLHKHGGTITSITQIGHETHKGVADWFFIGDVTWNDGTHSDSIHIAPYALCYENDLDKVRITMLLASLNQYLTEVGEWHDQKHKRDGRVYSWTPHEPSDRRPL